MKADRVNFEEPSESLEATRKARNDGFLDFLCKSLEEKGQIFAVPSRRSNVLIMFNHFFNFCDGSDQVSLSSHSIKNGRDWTKTRLMMMMKRSVQKKR